ncbi:hypothetical protein [Paractinoplanes lichenicola]|uniref:Uncharacterized protein n=1 Tax=Paractinoplanes lichenicola TaxID=2802976 RepID=A0ABS1VW77_9ACTN|nr:hypothetical protein [Actinoplanes lichenicola]MBL7258717.1 hypothetical protein [Actinoplanes lichenicola]
MPYEQTSEVAPDYLRIHPVEADAGRLIRLHLRGELDNRTAPSWPGSSRER